MCDPLLKTTTYGILKGKKVVNENGKIYYSYTGIPYAKSPVNDLRFKPPQKLDPWNGVFDATQYGNNCAAGKWFLKSAGGCEDCLYLNIYVPQNTSENPLPVMFWIHGGAFVVGSGNSDIHGPDYLIEYDIILVTINYRLGPLGFLNLEIEDAPGNVGLMDQVAALKWVNENIATFSGDPKNITICGATAGAASVHYHILSQLTKGLFHKAIAQSGSAFNPWAFQKNPVKNALRLCKTLGLTTNNPQEALDFLKNLPVETLLNTKLPQEIDGQLLDDFVFVPSIEKTFPEQDSYLTDLPISIINSGKFHKVPLLTGYNSAEGNLFFMYLKTDPDLLNKFEADFERFIPTDLELPLRSQKSIALGEAIREFYFQNKTISENMQNFVDVLSDNWFTRGIDEQVKLTVKNQEEPVFYYVYNFDENSPSRKVFGDFGIKGGGHADELGNIFKAKSANFGKETPNAVLVQRRMLEMWTNFTKFGNPTPTITDTLPIKWEPASKEKMNFLLIDTDLNLSTDPLKSRMQFWKKIK